MIPRTRNSYDITNYITEDMIILSIGSFIPGLLTGISFRLTNESPSSNMIMPFLGAELILLIGCAIPRILFPNNKISKTFKSGLFYSAMFSLFGIGALLPSLIKW